MSNVTVSSPSLLNKLHRFPWMLLIIVFLLTTELLNISLDGMVGYVFIGLAVVVLFIEFFKSGDVGAKAFFIDQVWAVLSLILATGLLTFLWLADGKNPSFYHWLGFVMIVADALLIPFNAYRTALRNLDVPD